MFAALLLSDGSIIEGKGFGAETKKSGELVFNTSMTGYQEALTDPSYAGQILLMTYPLIGNYGINKIDFESDLIHPQGFVVRQISEDYYHNNSVKNLDSFLKDHGTPGIYDIDTRAIVRKIRNFGVMPSILVTSKTPIDFKNINKNFSEYSNIDFVSKVSTKKRLVFGSGKIKVVLIDYGVKMSIVRELTKRNIQVHVLPNDTSTEEIKSLEPNGIVLSNGPGDPQILQHAHKTIRSLEGVCPIFGICLGHQLISHAFGGNTYKMKFGHRGSNHGVLDLIKNKVSMTTQNHGFAVKEIPKNFEVSHINVNDQSIEGLINKNKQIRSVQYHPEANPGPKDSLYLFDEFVKEIL